jgi:hypothetical protein
MIETSKDVISDEEIQRRHCGSFGPTLPRQVVDEGVFSAALGYSSGSTVQYILEQHGLIGIPRFPHDGPYDLTKKGRRYFRSLFRYRKISDTLALLAAGEAA